MIILKSCTWIEEDKAEFAKRLKGSVLDELAGLLSEEREKPSCNVITYNYDNLLEFFLKENYSCTEGREMKIFCEEDMDKVSEYKKINIYHPHGCLKVIEDNLEPKDTEKIILTESSYYRVEQKAYRWENSVQAKAFLDTSCIFIGFSGQDYNFRRMIKNIAHEDNDKSNKHFIFFCVDSFIEKLIGEEADKRLREQCVKEKLEEGIRAGMKPDKLSELVCRSATEVKSDSEYRKKWEAQIEEIMKEDNFAYENVQLLYFLYAQYMYWTRYGIVPIWTTFEELPGKVKRMRKNSMSGIHY